MTDKQLVLDAIQKLGSDTTLREIRDRLDFLMALREAEESVDRGESMPQEEVEREFAAWVKNRRITSTGQDQPSTI